MFEYIKSLITDPVALVGLLASLIVLISMCFNTRTQHGELLMRVLNLIGSVISVIYGIVLGPVGFGVIILNAPLIFINLFYVFKNKSS